MHQILVLMPNKCGLIWWWKVASTVWHLLTTAAAWPPLSCTGCSGQVQTSWTMCKESSRWRPHLTVSSLLCSFGFTEKGSSKLSQTAIGVYGNGFKSGSMRLGRDALIFTKNGGCQSVGLLSLTYLEKVKAQAVIVPIVSFNQQTNILHEENRPFFFFWGGGYPLFPLL